MLSLMLMVVSMLAWARSLCMEARPDSCSLSVMRPSPSASRVLKAPKHPDLAVLGLGRQGGGQFLLINGAAPVRIRGGKSSLAIWAGSGRDELLHRADML
jgi:hypothetical protein